MTEAAFDRPLAAGSLRRCYVDLPGHGESPAGPPDSDGIVDVVSGLLDREVPGQRFLLAGWSYGAYLAMALARRRPGDDEAYRERLRATGYPLSDEDSPARFGGPVTIVAGRQDGIVGYADQFRRLPCYPAGSFAVLDRAGHYLPFEQPRALAALVSEWSDRCLAG